MNLELIIETLLLLLGLIRLGVSVKGGDPDETEVDPDYYDGRGGPSEGRPTDLDDFTCTRSSPRDEEAGGACPTTDPMQFHFQSPITWNAAQ